jgi:phage gp36-like protein
MAYTTQANLQSRWPALVFWTDDDASGTVDSAITTAAIAAADAKIDLAASQHYATPLGLTDAVTETVIAELSNTLAGHVLAERTNDMASLEAMTDSYAEAVKYLSQLSSGKVSLRGETQASQQLPSGDLVMYGDTSPVTRTNMWGL